MSTSIPFTVDASLIRELGERLVGKPYVALAELIKNSYDADATEVEIEFTGDSIVVSDNGSGMTFPEFRDQWMRIGSPHKERQRESVTHHRPLTGSKGVGRLATQFLAEQLELLTFADGRDEQAIHVEIDWAAAAGAGDLTRATAFYDLIDPTIHFANDSKSGTTVTLVGLRHHWTPSDFEELARQVWSLQPPFRLVSRADGSSSFKIDLRSSTPSIQRAFEQQMSRILDVWDARVVGAITQAATEENGYEATVSISLESRDGLTESTTYTIPDSLIDSLDFELRIFKFEGKQPFGITVGAARSYMAEYGGAHIYDAGFRIPLGGPEADWLKLEFAHSHRLSKSELLPEELNVSDGLNYLPTNSRLWGVVNIDTALERRMATLRNRSNRDHLAIQVSRDRLVDNEAFEQLRSAVRWALDYYSVRTAWTQMQTVSQDRPVTPVEFTERVEAILEKHESAIPAEVRAELTTQLAAVTESIRSESLRRRGESALLGSLATAGIAALAIDHQVRQQLNSLDALADELEELSANVPGLTDAVRELRNWSRETRELFAVFAPLRDETDRAEPKRISAKRLLIDVHLRIEHLLRGLRIDLDGLSPDVLLPSAPYAAWASVFQNLLMNAANAMLDSPEKTVQVVSIVHGRRVSILVSDTGTGVDLENAEKLFEPFIRRLEISRERRQLGLGGTGLGLTIVRLIANDASATVRFVEPRPGFRTTCEIAWDEQGQRP